MAKTTHKSAEATFEAALERLEQIVGEMEGDKLPLEELLGRYEEGTRLVKVCQERLTSAEKRIELITKNAAGEVALSAFDPAAPAAEPAARPVSKRPSPDEEVSLF
ncbi:MAG: exodeoxyribonuclease VII small subunit [Verrucomicrobia bacterium]|nr:exodeoxyribonuclease VII small subunit [Verrucomicrobiota bacterium]